ncbi:glutathione-disulfide reductase [Cokeromyces recurvatus]|uniref:glutathione-disulfide reductase n=1 Tax=Cokeromyces recurvatus TaxID=90255 RepID=UPI00221F64ED|nr:glutathione-disulfide reductase [Cokeromyces recurvatus]XP_051380175.1 glutathione-disulfide reductase [Cokeromyces recurvatus]KAI7899096.1 glutathione-disulfide reductase [Cokeromyces recurvatus]KAI7900190.1 glutathione-disulfide reductase [Cokeromyces recurvatus]
MPPLPKPTKKEYDYIVIGAGSGGMAGARRAAGVHGASVAMIEKHSVLGGTCVNVGCVPKKVMWNTASIFETLRQAKGYGYEFSDVKFDWNTIKQKRDAYIQRLNGIYDRNAERENVEHFHGYASFVDNNTLRVESRDNDHSTFEIKGKKFLIATGSHAIVPNIPGAELGITSDGFFELEHQPKRVAVVGTGYIGIELAGIFHSLGSNVTVFSRTKQILRKFDTIIKDTLLDHMQKVGVQFTFDSKVTALRKTDTGITVEFESDGEKGQLEVDCVLWAVGRAASTDGLNLDAVGVKLNEKKQIIVDEYQNTTAENIYALGDVIGKAELTPVAIAASRKLSDRLFGVPSTIGYTEEEARKKFGDDNIKVYTSRFGNMYFSVLDEKEPTAYKIIVTGPEEKVVGLHIIGRGSDEILQGFGVAIRMGATKADFDNCVAIHPTSAEELVTMRYNYTLKKMLI